MCGISSIFVYDSAAPAVDEKELLKIRETMVNRGPDGAGIWISPDKRVGLAHRRLAIIDLSDFGAQPMADRTGQLHIVFNGEIYNFRALRSWLEKKGYQFRSNSDTEVLLYLYAEKGQEMVHDLRGMYAFVLWDSGHKTLFLARDPFGIKPLYYSDDGRTIRIASQVKALLKAANVDTSVEPAGQVGFFLWGSVPEPYTLYRKIKALPAGSTLSIDSFGKKNVTLFCDIAQRLIPASPAKTDLNRIEQLHDALLDSVKHHLVADVPVGVFLSSGRDSTTLTALAAEIAPTNLRTVTLGFEEYRGTINDEVSLAELVAHQYGAKHQTLWISQSEFQENTEHIFDVMDQPSIDGVNTYFVSKVAAMAGLKVALSGVGADELFGGYSSFREIPMLVNRLKVFSRFPVLGRLLRRFSAPLIKKITSSKYAGILEYGTDYGGAYLLRRGLFMPWELFEFLDPDLVREGLATLQTIPFLNRIAQGIDAPSAKVSALEMCCYMRNQLLRDSDWAGMAHTLEIRTPFIDIDLLKKVQAIGNSGFITKKELVVTPLTPLPGVILERSKTGFNIPVRQWAGKSSTRGLRGWARTIFQEYATRNKLSKTHILG